jgi:O-antigen/teichoic acid export membrane protein
LRSESDVAVQAQPRTVELGTVLPLRRVLRSEFVRHGSIVFASSTVVNLFNYVFHFFMSRRLGVVDYGGLASILAGLVLVSVPSAVLTMVVVRYAAEFKAVADLPRLRRLGDRVFTLTSIVGVLAFGACALLREPIARYLNIPDARVVAIAGIVLAVAVMLPGVRGVVQGAQDFKRLAVSTALEACCKLIFGIGFVVAGFGLIGAILGYAAGALVSLAYTLLVVRGYAPASTIRLRVDITRLYATTRGVALATFALTSMSFADLLLVKHFFSPEQAGLYGAISLVGKVLLFVVGFVPTIVLPKATARATHGQPALPILVQALGATILLSAIGLTVIAIAPAFVIRVMAGSAYLGATPYVLQYSIAMALLAGTSLVATYKIGLGKFDFVPAVVVAALGEVVAIQFFHARLEQVIGILVVGNGVALLAALAGVRRPLAAAVSRGPVREVA